MLRLTPPPPLLIVYHAQSVSVTLPGAAATTRCLTLRKYRSPNPAAIDADDCTSQALPVCAHNTGDPLRLTALSCTLPGAAAPFMQACLTLRPHCC